MIDKVNETGIDRRRKKTAALGYLILGGALSAGMVLFLSLPPVQHRKEIAILVLAAFYILWGIWFHGRRGDLKMGVVLEYIIMAALGMVLLLSLT